MPYCHQNDYNQLGHSEVLDSIFMSYNNFRMNDLPLFLKLLIFWDLLQVLSDLNQLGMKFVNLWLFCQFHQVWFIVGVKIKWNWFVFTVGGCETNVGLSITANVSLVVGASYGLSSVVIMWDDIDWDLLRTLASDFVWELDDFSRFTVQFKAKRTCWYSEVNRIDLTNDNQ